MNAQKPPNLPASPFFSSGPCAKHPGWTLSRLNGALLSRSHRSKPGKAKLKLAIDETRRILSIPSDYIIAITPASDTGAFEMALWSLLGECGVDAFSWESFGEGWIHDVVKQLKLKDARLFDAPYGHLPDLSQAAPDRDIVFLWNGTTSGVRVPNGDWISDQRTGLTICDATSAVFAQDIPWNKLDVATFSWQKVLGSEAAHGMIILSPRAVKRLETFSPPRALPKIFRMTKNGKLIKSLFEGATINTPSLLCVEDYLSALNWVQSIGGLKAMIARADQNLAAISQWVTRTDWVDFLCADPEKRSNTSVCLKITAQPFNNLPKEKQAAFVKHMADMLEKENAAYDADSYRDAPPGLRLWAGGTIETRNLETLFPWLNWAYQKTSEELLHAS